MAEYNLDYIPQERQLVLHLTTARQILYGGAAGGGKTRAVKEDCVAFALKNPGFHGAIFRKTLPELRTTHSNPIRMGLPKDICEWNEEQKKFYFINNSIITMGFCERPADVYRYLSEEFHAIYIDEASRFEPESIALLKTRLRLGYWKPSDPEDAKRLPRIVYATNPGGPSHSLLKRTIIDMAPPETVFHDDAMRNPKNPKDKGWTTIYIPAKMSDNKYLDEDYGAAFGALSPEQAEAYREGDWDVVVGQAVHNLSRKLHLLRQFNPPLHWTRFQVIDWGTAKPFSVGWYAVSEGATLKGKFGHPDRWLPKGAIIRYSEMYGWSGKENEGCRWSAPHVAQKIIQHETKIGGRQDYRVGDTEMWAQRGIDSVAKYFLDAGIVMRKSHKDRKRNYQEIISRLAGNPKFVETGTVEEDPMLFVTANCIHFWRTVPTLTYDEVDPEKGPDTAQEDHVYDEVAYACRSMPYVTTEEDRNDEEYNDAMMENGGGYDPYSTH